MSILEQRIFLVYETARQEIVFYSNLMIIIFNINNDIFTEELWIN